MTAALSFDAMRDNVIDNKTFQAACRRLEQGTGSSEAVVMAVLSAVGFPDLYLDALRYRFLRANSADAAHLDQTLDTSIKMQLKRATE